MLKLAIIFNIITLLIWKLLFGNWEGWLIISTGVWILSAIATIFVFIGVKILSMFMVKATNWYIGEVESFIETQRSVMKKEFDNELEECQRQSKKIYGDLYQPLTEDQRNEIRRRAGTLKEKPSV